MKRSKILKLGTRRSLLAMAQSQWVASQVMQHFPEVDVQLVGIETRGDRTLDIPLSQVEGKEFFVAELDSALQAGEIDFSVHSMKDLSLTRPGEFVCAAIPKRENPRDVILFGPRILDSLADGKTLRIGTSSPRRIENIPSFLQQSLPRLTDSQNRPNLQFREIRGNVNTRLSRLHVPVDSERHLDGVVLAFAGLIRLWADPQGREELKSLLLGVRWMVLPLQKCPAAPAQGALAVECRAQDEEVFRILRSLHHPLTEKHVRVEREVLQKWGGGCHQAFGATMVQHEALGELLWVGGRAPNGTRLDEMTWESPELPAGDRVSSWDGTEWREQESSQRVSEVPCADNEALFIAHSRAVVPSDVKNLKNSRIWTSGVSSWFKLAEQGVWVEGCAESLGFDFIKSVLEEPVLGLPSLDHWWILTHEGASSDWESYQAKVLSTYKVNSIYSDHSIIALQQATHVFWSSSSQFQRLKNKVRPNVHHACGPGKSLHRIRKDGVFPDVFPSVEEWRKWLKKV